MSLHKYLKKIQSGQTINFDRFMQLLQDEGYDAKTILEIFHTEKATRDRYRVVVLDHLQFQQMCKAYPELPVNDRISAAKAGDSHRHVVSKALLLLWPGGANHPVVVLNDEHGWKSPVALSERLLIIENQENFVCRGASLRFLQQQFPGFSIKGLDVVHGAGNAISNRLNAKLFKQYQQIDCWLDLDIGGLEIYRNLLNLTGHENLNFLLPPCTESLLKKSRIALSDQHLPDLRRYYRQCPALRPAINMMSQHKKMLEQELFLDV